MSYASTTIIGNIGKDPELKFLPNGNPVCRLSVATNENYTNNKGEKVKKTTWWNVSVFGKQGEAVASFKHKGEEVHVVGRMQSDPLTGGPRIWTGQDGTARASYELVAREITFIGKPNGARPASQDGTEGNDMGEDDIPFE